MAGLQAGALTIWAQQLEADQGGFGTLPKLWAGLFPLPLHQVTHGAKLVGPASIQVHPAPSQHPLAQTQLRPAWRETQVPRVS